MEYSRTEIRTGLIIVIAGLVGAIVIFVVGDFSSLFKEKITFTVVFDNSSGIRKYSEVRYAGVKVGEVQEISFTDSNPQQVVIQAEVRRDANIQEGADARVKTLGFLGERYVDIVPPAVSGKPLEDGAVLNGKSAKQLEDIGIALGDLGSSLAGIRDHLDDLLGDDEFKKNLTGTVERAKELTGELQEMLAENRPAIRDTLSSAKSATSEVDELLREHRDDLSSALKHLASLSEKLDGMADDLENLASKSSALIDRNEENLDRTIADMRVTARNIRELSSDLKRRPHRLIKIFPSIFPSRGGDDAPEEKDEKAEASEAP